MIKLESFLEKPISKFILWFLTGLLIIFYGIINAKADTLQSFTYFNRTSLPFSTYYSASEEQEYGSDYFLVDKLYKYIYVNMCSTGYLSANPQGIDGSITFLAHKFLNTSCSTGGYTGKNSVMIYMVSKWNDAGNGNYGISFKENLKNNSDYSVYITVNSITSSDELIYDIDNSLQSDILEQNKETNDKLDNLDETIKDSNQQLQDSITESNKETQEVIKDQFNSCRPSINLQPNEFRQGIYNATTGVFSPNSNYLANINFISVKPNTNYVFSSDLNYSFEAYLYDSNKNYIGRAFAENNKFTTTSETYYINWRTLTLGQNSTSIKMQLQEGTVATDYEPYGEEVCSNKIDETNDKLDQTNDKLDNIDDTLNNSDIDDDNVFSSFEDFNNFLDDNSTITQLVTLPITLYTAILNNVNGSCTPFNLGNLYGVNLSLPCVNLGNYLGPVLWGMIDIIISGFAVYYISKKLVKIFNNVSSMKEGDVIDD